MYVIEIAQTIVNVLRNYKKDILGIALVSKMEKCRRNMTGSEISGRAEVQAPLSEGVAIKKSRKAGHYIKEELSLLSL